MHDGSKLGNSANDIDSSSSSARESVAIVCNYVGLGRSLDMAERGVWRSQDFRPRVGVLGIVCYGVLRKWQKSRATVR
jgi:hypothetical protein